MFHPGLVVSLLLDGQLLGCLVWYGVGLTVGCVWGPAWDRSLSPNQAKSGLLRELCVIHERQPALAKAMQQTEHVKINQDQHQALSSPLCIMHCYADFKYQPMRGELFRVRWAGKGTPAHKSEPAFIPPGMWCRSSS